MAPFADVLAEKAVAQRSHVTASDSLVRHYLLQ
jgi:hypothetical protein